MQKNLAARAEVTIEASPSIVWEALTRPDMISQYLFGTNTETTWKVGDPIRFSGEYNGLKYEDKGTILENEPRKKLKYSYWSSMSGKADRPENYVEVSFELIPEGPHNTRLVLVNDKHPDEKSREHSEQNWTMVLGKLKQVAESAARLNAF